MRLVFEAKIGKVEIKAGAEQSYGESKPGELHVMLRVTQPVAGRKPVPSWAISDGGDRLKPRPTIPEKAQKGQTAEAFDEAVTSAARSQVGYDRDLAAYQRELAAYEVAVARLRDATMAYAQLVGMAAVFGSQTVRVEITPNTDMLPGFAGVSLLPEPEPAPTPSSSPDFAGEGGNDDDEDLDGDEGGEGDDE